MNSEDTKQTQQPLPPQGTGLIKLLIVDDDEDDCILVQDLLDEMPGLHYELQCAPTFEEGREWLSRNAHDLCLMDYRLGARDGIELLTEATQLGFTGPIILLTGMASAEVDRQALDAGAVDYLAKAELSPERLARSIRYALARRDVEQERVERLKAEAESRSKSQFMAHLSHELRTPLAAILGFTELLLAETDDSHQEHLRIIQRNGKHLQGLLNDILDLSKIEAGRLELEPQPLRLASLLADIQFMMQGAIIDKQLAWHIDCPEPLPVTITTDPTRLRQVLVNLIGNAIKFTDQGEIRLRLLPEFNDGQLSQLRFSIQDTGMGIASDIQQQIFQPFVQSPDNPKGRPGTGLGLAICRQLVTMLGGEINVESEQGRGSTFTFTLDPGPGSGDELQPLHVRSDQPRYTHHPIPQLQGKVLVVDDLPDIRTLVSQFARQAGLRVYSADSGEQALTMLAQHSPFDCVLMDIQMPGLDGYETARLLREKGYNPPLIALTASHMPGDRERCLAAGFNDYLAKPVEQKQLYEHLQAYVYATTPPQRDRAQTDEENHANPALPVSASILLIDDDPDTLSALSELLQVNGYSCQSAQSAREALQYLDDQGGHLDMIITDLNLPDANGYELIERISGSHPNVRMVVISGEEISQHRLPAAGIHASFLKPVAIAELLPVLPFKD